MLGVAGRSYRERVAKGLENFVHGPAEVDFQSRKALPGKEMGSCGSGTPAQGSILKVLFRCASKVAVGSRGGGSLLLASLRLWIEYACESR